MLKSSCVAEHESRSGRGATRTRYVKCATARLHPRDAACLWLVTFNPARARTRFHENHYDENIIKKKMIDELPATLQKGLVKHLYGRSHVPSALQ